jgi:hypothetical protein
MAGPGMLVLGRPDKPGIMEMLSRKLPDIADRVSFYVNDVSYESLRKLPEKMLIARCDVRELGQRFPVQFHIVAVRYGIKDLPQGEQAKALVSIRDSIVPGGRLVIADMTAYNARQQECITHVHTIKQTLAGRNIDEEGTCHIPTLLEWKLLLRNAGFKNVTITFTGTSDVNTTQWAGQFGGNDKEKISAMNDLIRVTAADRYFKNGCDVRFDGGQVTLKFPIMVITGDKQQSEPFLY